MLNTLKLIGHNIRVASPMYTFHEKSIIHSECYCVIGPCVIIPYTTTNIRDIGDPEMFGYI